MIANLALADLALAVPVVCLLAFVFIASYPLPLHEPTAADYEAHFADTAWPRTQPEAYALLLQQAYTQDELNRLIVEDGYTATELVSLLRAEGYLS